MMYKKIFHSYLNNYDIILQDYVCYGFGFSEFLAQKLDELFLEKQGLVLDAGVGAGTISIALAEYGFEVEGLDVSPVAVDTCKKTQNT